MTRWVPNHDWVCPHHHIPGRKQKVWMSWLTFPRHENWPQSEDTLSSLPSLNYFWTFIMANMDIVRFMERPFAVKFWKRLLLCKVSQMATNSSKNNSKEWLFFACQALGWAVCLHDLFNVHYSMTRWCYCLHFRNEAVMWNALSGVRFSLFHPKGPASPRSTRGLFCSSTGVWMLRWMQSTPPGPVREDATSSH